MTGEVTLSYLMSEYKRVSNALSTRMKSVGEELLREAKRLCETPDLDSYAIPVNSLGVLQGRGPEIDRMCGELSTIFDAIKSLSGEVSDAR